jgi:dihydrofolate reductase
MPDHGHGHESGTSRGTVSRLTCNMMVSLDGYSAAPQQSAENPFGIGGMRLNEWLLPLKAFREMHGEDGGQVNASSAIVESWFDNVGATVMGRNMFGGGPGPWDDDPWNGYWGDEPPYHHPVFVLTHHPREPLEMQGGTTFHFVTGGIEPALERAKEAAGDQNVSLGGGAATVQQYMAAGLLDEILISLAPIFLGGGTRLFDGLGDARARLEPVEVVDAPGVTHIRYRVE